MNVLKNKEKKMNQNKTEAKTLEGVHTHTHTHTHRQCQWLFKIQKNNRKYKDTCTLYVFWDTKVYIKYMCLFVDSITTLSLWLESRIVFVQFGFDFYYFNFQP